MGYRGNHVVKHKELTFEENAVLHQGVPLNNLVSIGFFLGMQGRSNSPQG